MESSPRRNDRGPAARSARAVAAVACAAAIFAAIGLPTGVLAMIDQRYCFNHADRPPTTAFHEEGLSFFPPGPRCRFVLPGGDAVVAGPGWWPATALAAALAGAVVTLRLTRGREAR